MKLIILDRDGVINEDSDNYVRSVAEWHPIPGSIEAIARLSKAGYKIAVATNQSGIGRGYFSVTDLDEMHARLDLLVRQAGGVVDSVVYCPHSPEAHCDCRKPLPGLLDQVMQQYGLDELARVPCVGDSIRDLQAGNSKGCALYLVRTGKGLKSERQLPDYPDLHNVAVVENLAAVADLLLSA